MNFSLSEILLVLLIALLVIKPEELPGVAHSLGKWLKSIRGMFDKVKDEVNGFIETVEKPADDQSPKQ